MNQDIEGWCAECGAESRAALCNKCAIERELAPQTIRALQELTTR